MNRRKHIGVWPYTVLTALPLFAIIVDSAYAADWRRMSRAIFPAKVQAVVFDNKTLDARTGLRWGNWSVSFAETTPVAHDRTRGHIEGEAVAIYIEGLACWNEVVGKVDCVMVLAWTREGNTSVCMISPVGIEPFSIRCPRELTAIGK